MEDFGSPTVGVTGSCEPQDTGVGSHISLAALTFLPSTVQAVHLLRSACLARGTLRPSLAQHTGFSVSLSLSLMPSLQHSRATMLPSITQSPLKLVFTLNERRSPQRPIGPPALCLQHLLSPLLGLSCNGSWLFLGRARHAPASPVTCFLPPTRVASSLSPSIHTVFSQASPPSPI